MELPVQSQDTGRLITCNSIMPVLLLRLQEEEDDVLGAAQQLLAKFKISWHL